MLPTKSSENTDPLLRPRRSQRRPTFRRPPTKLADEDDDFTIMSNSLVSLSRQPSRPSPDARVDAETSILRDLMVRDLMQTMDIEQVVAENLLQQVDYENVDRAVQFAFEKNGNDKFVHTYQPL